MHYELGWNYRLTNLQAAIGLAQLERLDEFVAKKRTFAKMYDALFQDMEDKVQLPLAKTGYADNIYWVYGLILKDTVNYNAEEMIKRLSAEGIGSRPFFYPMHLQPVFNKMDLFKSEKYPVAENLGERGFYVPSGLALTENEMKTVSEKLHKILAN